MRAIFRCNYFHLLKHTFKIAEQILWWSTPLKYFTADQIVTLDANSWILHSFTYDGITTATKDLIDLQSDFGMKALFKETP